MSLRQTIYGFINDYFSKEKIYSSVCTVISVNEAERTCQLSPVNGDAERKGRIQANLSLTEGIYIKPIVGSKVLLTYINNKTGIITSYSEIENIVISIDSTSFEMSDGETVFNGGVLGGLPVTSEIVSRLNLIENKVNDLILFTQTHVHTGVTTGGGSTLVSPDPVTGNLINTNDSHIENEDIKQ